MEKHISEQNTEQHIKHFIIVLKIILLGSQLIFDDKMKSIYATVVERNTRDFERIVP